MSRFRTMGLLTLITSGLLVTRGQRCKISWTICRIPVRPFDYRVKAGKDGKVLTTDGPYLETKEHIGGFWVLEVASLEDALARGRKAVVACRVPVEVRAFGIPT